MPLTDEEKIHVIEQALSCDEGRTAIAQAIVNSMNSPMHSYNEMGRKLLKMDETIKEEIPDPIDNRFDILDL